MKLIQFLFVSQNKNMMWIIWTLSAVFNIIFLKEVNDDEFGLWCVLVAILGPFVSILILAETCAKILKEK